MKIHPAEQGSVDWMLARAGIPTASEFDALVTPDFKIRTGQMPQTYLAKKVAEAWQGGPLAGFNVWDVEQGQILETEARPWLSLEYGIEIQSVGLITTDDGKVGCSPDGLWGENMGVEIKCPSPDTHVKYLLGTELPKDYAAQVHGGMFVTGFKQWRFLSYRRHFPPLLLTVQRDEKIQAVLAEVLEGFLARFQDALARLTELNGGVRPERKPLMPIPAPETEEVTP